MRKRVDGDADARSAVVIFVDFDRLVSSALIVEIWMVEDLLVPGAP